MKRAIGLSFKWFIVVPVHREATVKEQPGHLIGETNCLVIQIWIAHLFAILFKDVVWNTVYLDDFVSSNILNGFVLALSILEIVVC